MVGAGGPLSGGGGVVPEVPGYRIERQLGRGSMGVVYLAEDVQLRRKVALKILAPALADDELFRQRFGQESQSVASLDHPSIVPVYAAGEAGGLLYIAMRYVGGGDLRALLEANGPLSLEQATSVIAPVADALDAAHAQGMIHRDVKPANILIDGRNGQEHFYLSDFGITKIVSSGRSSLTSTGQIVGTIDYIAPEQIQGKPVDGRADLYALGCVLYQCLTGVVPFPRDETAALMWAHVHEEPPPVTSRRPDLPREIDYIVAKAMAKQPENRFATCRKLAIALRTVADPAVAEGIGGVLPAEPLDSSPSPVSADMTSTYAPPSHAPVRAPKTATLPGWRWWWLAAAGVLVLALAGGTAGVLNYLDSRFPNDAELALLDQVPLAMRDSCMRNTDTAYDTASVQASVTCTSDDEVNRVVFTKFTSDEALNDHYRLAVAATGISQGSGDCRSAERAEGDYVSESAQTSGQALCYQQLGSSFIKWTDDESHTLGVATRTDPDYEKLRGWWAGVVGIKVPDPEPTPAPSPPPPAVAAPAPAPERRAPVPDPPAAAPAPPAPERDSGGSGEQDGGEQDDDDTPASPPTSETTTPPPTTTTTPAPATTTTPPPTSPIELSGPTPAAPGPQRGGPPVPGTGGCTKFANARTEAETSNYYACTVTEAAPAYLPETIKPRGELPARQYPFQCQSKGSKYSVGDRTSHWWAWVGERGLGVWAPVVFLDGSSGDAPVPGLPECDSAPPTTTAPTTTAPTTTTTPPTKTTTAPATTTTASPTETTTPSPSASGKPRE